MMIALNQSGERIYAEPEANGICPVCSTELVPKCGEINAWHWAHKSLKECDTWSEPEGEWHYGWKMLAGLENTEIVIEKDGQIHRVDIKTSRGLVIEVQHSPLSPKEVREREEFYGNMVWIIDGDEVCPEFRLERYVSREENLYFKRDKIKKAWVNEITKPCFLNFKERVYNTYYYYNEYILYNGILNKKLKKDIVQGGSERAGDILVQLNGKYCNVISKPDFITKFIPQSPRRQKSLFAF